MRNQPTLKLGQREIRGRYPIQRRLIHFFPAIRLNSEGTALIQIDRTNLARVYKVNKAAGLWKY